MLHRSKNLRRLSALVAVPIALAVAGCGAGDDATAGGTSCEGATVRAGTTNSTSDAVLFIAKEKGYFSDQGLNVEFTQFDSAAKMIAPLGSGQLDVGAGAPSAGFYNAVARDIDLRIVADKGSMPAGYGYMPLLVRKDLVESGKVKDISDLKGLKVAEPAEGTSTSSTLSEILADGDLSYDDVDHQFIGFPEHVTSFQNGAIDASMTTEPSASIAIQQGAAVLLEDPAEHYDNQQLAVALYSGQFATERKAAAQCFMDGYVQAARDYATAVKDGDLAGAEAEEIVSIVSQQVGLEPELYTKITPNYVNPDGAVNLESLKKDYAFFEEQGWLESDVDVEGLVDSSFAEKATKNLDEASQSGS